MNDIVKKRYLEEDYLLDNPEWDIKDSPWKAEKVHDILKENDITPQSFCDVGCGAGRVLTSLRSFYPEAKCVGYDIAPDVQQFWNTSELREVELNLGNFTELNSQKYDVILLLDVLEHVADPHNFLTNIKPYCRYLVIHFPLDLSSISVMREAPLLEVRRKVGHIHFFTRGLALELLAECGLEVVDWKYTGASLSAPNRKFKTRLFGFFRRIFYLFNKDIGVRLVGGETLIVLAKYSE